MVLYLQQTKMLTVELVPLIVVHSVEKINKRILSFKAPNSEVTMLLTVLQTLRNYVSVKVECPLVEQCW